MSRLVMVALCGWMGSTPLSAQPQTHAPELLQKTTVGSELYRFYCASCHGLDGHGRTGTGGIRTPSSDLTLLSVRNGGTFPAARVRGVLEHGSRALPGHGPTDMPVWGAIFRALGPDDALVSARLDNLVAYLASIQQGAGVGRSH